MSRTIICILISILHLTLIPSAFASTRPIIGLFDLSSDSIASEVKQDIKNQLENELKKQGFFKNVRTFDVDLSKVLFDSKATVARQELESAALFYQRGKKSHEDLNLNQALQELLVAEQKMLTNLAYVHDASLLLKVYLYIGLTYLAKGIEGRADEEFAKALTIDPGVSITERDFAPDIVKQYRAKREEILQKPRGELNITTHPPDAYVFIDGKKREEKTVSLHAGEHFIRVTYPGYDEYFEKIEISPRARIERDITLPSLAEKYRHLFKPITSSNELSEERLSIFKALARTANCEVILLGSIDIVDEDSLLVNVQLFDMRSFEYSKTFTVEIHKPSYSELKVFAKSIASEVKTKEHEFPELAETQSSHSSFYKSPWFWVPLSVIALGGISYLLIDQFILESGTEELSNQGSITIRFPGD